MEKLQPLCAIGATPVALDAFNRPAVIRAVVDYKPDVVIHQLTAIGYPMDMRKFDQEFALTNRLRTEALDIFIEAAVMAGTPRVIAQSFTGWPNARQGSLIKTEEDPLDVDPAPTLRTTLNAIQYLEERITGESRLHGIALRYGAFYGTGTPLSPGGALWEEVRHRKVPIVGGGRGVWSFIHIDDVVGATVAALQRGDRGVYNIVDDDPAPVHEWLPYLAAQMGAPPPRHVPAWLARFVIGSAGVSVMTDIRGSANGKAKRQLGWRPTVPSWRIGFRAASELDAHTADEQGSRRPTSS
jgi:nucleoside-diphosphate-sugar epimerase